MNVPIERIAPSIYVIRGESVMIDSDLSTLYEITTGNLNKAVKRNMIRFPEDFMFQLTLEEHEALLFQNGIPKNSGRGGRRTLPYVFTEQGIAMLSSVLKTDKAAEINIAIMRTFVRIRKLLGTNEKIVQKIKEHDKHISNLYKHVEKLLDPPKIGKRNPIGFKVHKEDDSVKKE